MVELKIRIASDSDVKFVSERLSEDDLRSIAAATEMPPYEAMLSSSKHSHFSYTIYADYGTFQQPLAVCGTVRDCVPGDGRKIAQIWCVATDTLRREFGKEFSRIAKRWIQGLLNCYDVLHNVEDARNEMHIKWLRFCGFQMIARIDKFGPLDLPHLHFAIYK